MFNPLRNPARQAEVISALQAVAESGMFSNGLAVYNLERFFHRIHDNSAVALNSSGSAFYTVFRFYREQGHKAIAIPNNSFYSVGAMALEAGLQVYLVDSSAEHPSIGYSALLETRAWHKDITLVMVGHVGGWVAAQYTEISNLCMDEGLVMLEDCTHALGITPGPLSPGRFGDASIWGFQSQGTVPVGEGGIICTHNTKLKEYATRFRSYGKHLVGVTPHYGVGMSLGMSEWAAAVATIQLKHLPDIIEARRQDADRLQSIAPCLLAGDSNYCKYPVHPHHANKRKTTSSFYNLNDQLASALPKNPNVHIHGNLIHSSRWAQNHKCLPIGEGVYRDMDDNKIVEALRVA